MQLKLFENMAGMQLLVCILFLALDSALGLMEGQYNVTQACTLLMPNRNVGSLESCSTYYQCAKAGPIKKSCSEGYSFDKTSSSCAPANKVTCYLDDGSPCAAGQDKVWVPMPGSCRGYYYCNNGVSQGPAFCNADKVFNANLQMCTHGDCNDEPSGSGELTLQNWCQVMPSGVYFGDTLDCSGWHICTTAAVLINGNCPMRSGKQTVFDTSKESCEYQTPTMCDRIKNGGVIIGSLDCDTNGEKFANPNICGSYFICENNKKVSYTCPDLKYYMQGNEPMCVTRQQATPIKSCDTCQYSGATFVNAVDPNCQKYYNCKTEELSMDECKTGYFMDEDMGGCRDTKYLDAYRKTHGACKLEDIPQPNDPANP